MNFDFDEIIKEIPKIVNTVKKEVMEFTDVEESLETKVNKVVELVVPQLPLTKIPFVPMSVEYNLIIKLIEVAIHLAFFNPKDEK